MKDPIALIDAILDVYDNSKMLPEPDGTTHCNQAVDAVSQAVGYNGLAGKTADEIVSFLSTSLDWQLIPITQAQDLANEGSLLIAGIDSKALGQDHGHVVVIRPGKPCYSGKWGLTPRCLNVGQENFIARAKKGPLTNQAAGLNEAFIPLPRIWVWRGSL